jgi:starch synthase (maltosyl-transferring)
MMDLVVNHTSKDSLLVGDHPAWYRWSHGELLSPSVTDPDDPSKETVWGDLAEIDNEFSPDRDALWEYWADLVTDSLDLGFSGFRCDAAYLVPVELWRFLIGRARQRNPHVRFFAETLGAPADAVLALKSAGFDFFFNSSKWWNFRDPWALEQHERFGAIAPSVSFPETHDTPRLADETAGSEAIQRQRYAFALAFSAGVMMPLGYEYGFRRRTDVVRTMPSDWERKAFDLSAFVTRANRLKLDHAHLQSEGHLRAVHRLGSPVLVLERRVEGEPEPALIVVNTDSSSERELLLDHLPFDPSSFLALVCRDDDPGLRSPTESIQLRPAEVAYVLPRSDGRGSA